MKNLRKNLKKTVVVLFTLIFSTSVLLACSKDTKKDVSTKDIGEKISQSTDLSKMKQGDNSKLEKLYKIKPGEVEEFVLYTAPSNIKADEIAVIKVKGSSKIEDVKGKIEKRIKKQTASFKDYLPEEYALMEKHVLKEKGNYIIFVVSKDVDKIEKAIDESFK
ncbi:hypothetical protein Z968_05235 [Clostridium novyi A str. 4552]|uniref:Lipoprotein n=1 Tax=Clostridium novyi A str. 4552 TaxID=1444289 RepID=A0A0A0I7N7_CLONO|nr:DUF4358 domain-containing protein [Clostridium novyi]KGM96897.1 hypothetical protein Z968_05235 [Clostridium novyi A str. 4552]